MFLFVVLAYTVKVVMVNEKTEDHFLPSAYPVRTESTSHLIQQCFRAASGWDFAPPGLAEVSENVLFLAMEMCQQPRVGETATD